MGAGSNKYDGWNNCPYYAEKYEKKNTLGRSIFKELVIISITQSHLYRGLWYTTTPSITSNIHGFFSIKFAKTRSIMI